MTSCACIRKAVKQLSHILLYTVKTSDQLCEILFVFQFFKLLLICMRRLKNVLIYM